FGHLMKIMTTQQMWYLFGTFVEHLLLAVSIGLLIPPIPSMEGQQYSFGGMHLATMLVFLAASRVLAMLRGEESILGFVLKAGILTIAGFVNYERMFIH